MALRGDRPCPACAADRPHRIEGYSPADWDVVACNACGFVYLRNPPPYEALQTDLAWEKTYVAKKQKGGSTPLSGLGARLRTLGRRLRGRTVEDRYPEWFGTGRVLDIGCADRVRTAAPITPYGIEISAFFQARADEKMRARGGFCLLAPGAEGVWQFEPEFLDGVILHSYLEHETQPLRVLQGVARALKPGGRVFVRVPNYGSVNRRIVGRKWCGFRHPDHVNYFTARSLARMSADAGLSMRLLNRAHLWFDDNILALLVKS